MGRYGFAFSRKADLFSFVESLPRKFLVSRKKGEQDFARPARIKTDQHLLKPSNSNPISPASFSFSEKGPGAWESSR